MTTPTLYRSALHLDPRHPAIAGALADVHWMHRHIMSAWSGYTETNDFFTGTATGHPDHRASLGILYALSAPRPDGSIIAITQAHQRPDWQRAQTQAAAIGAELAERWGGDASTYSWTDALLAEPVDSIRPIEEPGTQIVFELRGQPSKQGGRRRGLDGHHADNWAVRKLTDAGLRLHHPRDADPLTPPVASSQPVTLLSPTKTERTRSQQKHAGGQFQLRTLRWQGTATIIDHDAYRQAVATGIGPGKPYGCGLLLTRKLPHR